jgi:2-octaprenyl-6-methoxyphenol hydroxylase
MIAAAPFRPATDLYDIAIVGGGIVGHTLALALQQSDLKVILIEAQTDSLAKDRSYVLSILSGQIFSNLGIWEQVLPHFSQFSQIQISDADHPTIVQLFPQDLGTTALGYAAGHQTMLTALQEKLSTTPNFTYLCPATVERLEPAANHTELLIQTPTQSLCLRANLVIGADGSKSPLRQQAGIPTTGWAYWQSCVTAIIQTEHPHQNIAYERFWYDGPMGVLPLADGRMQIVWTAPHDRAQELRDMPTSDFIACLETATGNLLGQLTLDSPRVLFPVKLMQSDRYVQNRLALVGDAAHCCHPVAGQGMNLGIRDAAALAEIILAAHAQGEDIGSLTVLDRYQLWRKPENWAILAFTDFLDRLFSNRWWPIVFGRRIGLQILQRVPLLKHLSLRLMTGLAGHLPQLGLKH